MSILSFLFRPSKKTKVEQQSKSSFSLNSSDYLAYLPQLEDCQLIDTLRKNGRSGKALEMALTSIHTMEEHAPKAEKAWWDNDRAMWKSVVGDISEYEPIVIDSVDDRVPWGVTPAYYMQAAMIYRKRKDYAAEVDILQRFSQMEHNIGRLPDKLLLRLDRAKELQAKAV